MTVTDAPATPSTPTIEPVVRPVDGREATWFLNGVVTWLVTSAETGGAYHLAEHHVTAASNPPVHVHTDEDEGILVLEGEVEVEIEGETTLATPGAYAHLPRGRQHTWRVRSDSARMLVLCTGKPADNFEGFVKAMGQPAPSATLPEPGPPDVDRLVRLAGAAGIVFS